MFLNTASIILCLGRRVLKYEVSITIVCTQHTCAVSHKKHYAMCTDHFSLGFMSKLMENISVIIKSRFYIAQTEMNKKSTLELKIFFKST